MRTIINSINYPFFDDTEEIAGLRRDWLIARESYGDLTPEALGALKLLLAAWLKHTGLPLTPSWAETWLAAYTQQALLRRIDHTAKLGSSDPAIIGNLGDGDVLGMIQQNMSNCKRCSQPVFWANIVKRDGTEGRVAPFDPTPPSSKASIGRAP